MSIFSKNLGGHGPFPPPSSADYSSSADSSLVLAVSLYVYYLLLSISIINFMSKLKRAFIVELVWTQSRRQGRFW